jgi:hypothetical protein
MIIRFVSIIFTKDDDDASYSLEFASNDDDSILGDFSLFLLLALDIL